MLASNTISLPRCHSSASESRAGKLRQAAPRAGGAETGRDTGAKEFKSELAKRLGWRLREPTSLRAPCRLLGSSLLALHECRSLRRGFFRNDGATFRGFRATFGRA